MGGNHVSIATRTAYEKRRAGYKREAKDRKLGSHGAASVCVRIDPATGQPIGEYAPHVIEPPAGRLWWRLRTTPPTVIVTVTKPKHPTRRSISRTKSRHAARRKAHGEVLAVGGWYPPWALRALGAMRDLTEEQLKDPVKVGEVIHALTLAALRQYLEDQRQR